MLRTPVRARTILGRMNTNTPSKPLAISYARFSTSEQADGDSLRRQSILAKDYCLKNGYHLIEDRSYFDSGVSAYKGKNKTEGQLGTLLQDAEAGVFPRGTRLIVESFDRLGRESIPKQYNLFTRLLDAGLVIVTFDGGRAQEHSLETGNDIVTVLTVVLTMARANEESRFKSARVGEAWAAKRERATTVPMTKIAPYWLDLVDGKFEVIEERAEIVRKIFALSKNGLGRRSIAALLNREKVPVWSGPKRNPLGIWRDSYIAKIVSNPAVLGHYQPHRKVDGKRIPEGELIQGYFPPIISEDAFFAVNHRVQRRKGKGGRGVDKANNLFSGIGRCYCCGGPLHFANKGSNWKYLRCERKSLEHNACESLPLNYSTVEHAVLRNLREINWNFVLDEGARLVEWDQSAALTGEIASIQKKMETLLEVATEGMMERPLFIAKFQELQSRSDELTRKLEESKESRAHRRLDRELSIEATNELQTTFAANLSLEQRLRLKSAIRHLVKEIVAKRGEDGSTIILVRLGSGTSLLVKVAGKDGGDYSVTELRQPLKKVDAQTIEAVLGGAEVEGFRLLVKNLAA
jgi:DNA invertase Pin-like site-specific DNA recombinase